MFYSVDGKIVEVGGRFVERKDNSLSFKVEGTQFPKPLNVVTTSNGFRFTSSKPQSVTVNFGDGVSETYLLKLDSANNYSVGWTKDSNPSFTVPSEILQASHTYQDNFSGERIVTFDFEDLSKIIYFISKYQELIDFLPRNIVSLKGITRIDLVSTGLITSLPVIGNLENLTFLILSSISIEPFIKIPDSFFNSPLETLIIGGAFDLSDPISSNLYKVNQFLDLQVLRAKKCNIKILPKDIFKNSTKLEDLGLDGNLIENPEELEKINSPVIKFISISLNLSVTNYLFNTSNYNNLSNLYITVYNTELINQIPNQWKGLKNIDVIPLRENSIQIQSDWDLFIDKMYELCTSEGSIIEDVNAFAGVYPYRFRNISWGWNTINFTQTGAIQAPAGFVQGVDNGNLPMTQGEKIYVLVNNYGHNITTSGNFN